MKKYEITGEGRVRVPKSFVDVEKGGIVGFNVRVRGNAKVCSNAEVYGNAKVCSNAEVSGNTIYYFTRIY